MRVKMDLKDLENRLIRLTCDLVNIPTENRPPNGDEKHGQEYIKRTLSDMGLEITEISPFDIADFDENRAFLKERKYEGRNNIIGRWRGNGKGKSLLLSGHIDVAPKEPYPWTVTEPFESLVKNNRIYGRGSADMKGGLACAISAMEFLKINGFEPSGDIIFESVVDEEFAGSTGTIVSRMLGYNADYGILLEPTGLSICPACVGGLVLRITVTGMAGMPYTGEEIRNPAYAIAEVIGHLQRYDDERRKKMILPALWDKTPQKPQVVILKVKAGEVEPHGQLSIPIDAWVEFVVQTLPGEDVSQIICEIETCMSSIEKFRLEPQYHYCKAAAPVQDDMALKMLTESVAELDSKANVCGAMFSCDLYAFEEFGDMPTVIFGPKGGRLHAPDEWVDIDSQMVVTRSLISFIRKWCG